MSTEIIDHSENPNQVIKVLTQHLPYSLPLLRRLKWPTPTSHVLSTSADTPGEDLIAAYVDLSNCPETEIWIYSSIEHPKLLSNEAICEAQVLSLFTQIKELERSFPGQRKTPGVVFVATLHARILEMLEKHDLIKRREGEYSKFLFLRDDLPAELPLPDGSVWGEIKTGDIELVLSRTSIPYQPKTIAKLTSAAIKTSTGKPIAWVFLGPDGSMKVLHCEKEYRGQGLAKAVASRLLREKVVAEDGMSTADVSIDNAQSRGVCKSLGGVPRWSVYYTWVDLERLGE